MKVVKWVLAGVGGLVVVGLLVMAALGHGLSQAQQPGEGKQAYEEALAAQLGIDVQTLRNAQQAALDQVLQDAVASGRLKQEQADKIKEQPKLAGALLMKRGAERIKAAFGDIFAAAANALGMSPDELKVELRNGKSVAQIASEKNIPLSDVKTAVTSEITNNVNEAVANGDLRQEQADKILSGLSERLDQVLQRSGEGLRGLKKN
jgi:hypothetical protein